MTFKKAETAAEFAQIHALNYRTFVEEVGQYEPDGTGVLVDRFHSKNTYFIALDNAGTVAGMLAVHDEPPFSAAARLADPAILAGLGRPMEVRLLAIAQLARHRMILAGLLWNAFDEARRRGCTHLVISGRTEKLRLYERLGFGALGPAVPAGEASFVPMVLAVAAAAEHPLRRRIQSRAKCFAPSRSLVP